MVSISKICVCLIFTTILLVTFTVSQETETGAISPNEDNVAVGEIKEVVEEQSVANINDTEVPQLPVDDWRPCFLDEATEYCSQKCKNDTEGKCRHNIQSGEIDCGCGLEKNEVEFTEHICKARCIKGFCGAGGADNCTCLSTAFSHYSTVEDCNSVCSVECIAAVSSSPEYPTILTTDLLCNWECPCQTKQQCENNCQGSCTKEESECFQCEDSEIVPVIVVKPLEEVHSEHDGHDHQQHGHEDEAEDEVLSTSSPLGLLPMSALVAVMVGILVLLVLVSLAVFIIFRKRRARSHTLATRSEYHKQETIAQEVSDEPLVA